MRRGCSKKASSRLVSHANRAGQPARADNCHIGVLVTQATPQGPLWLDRARYLPTEWTNDEARCKRTGVPTERTCATKPPLAQQMLTRAFDAGVPAAWVTGESV